MKFLRGMTLVFASLASVVMLTSAYPSSNVVNPTENTATVVTPIQTPEKNKANYKELKSIATKVKGSKLTLKEKISLKLFGKKISKSMPAGGSKSQLVALLICAFVGGIGIHRFYLGYTWQGIVQLLTLGGCGIWSLIDFIRICLGTLQPKDGEYDKTL